MGIDEKLVLLLHPLNIIIIFFPFTNVNLFFTFMQKCRKKKMIEIKIYLFIFQIYVVHCHYDIVLVWKNYNTF